MYKNNNKAMNSNELCMIIAFSQKAKSGTSVPSKNDFYQTVSKYSIGILHWSLHSANNKFCINNI